MPIKEELNQENAQAPVNDDWQCSLTIKGIRVRPQNIKSLVIKEWIFDVLPTLELIVLDDGIFIDKWPLEDGDEIVVEMNRDLKEEKDSPILMEFILQDFEIENTDADKIQVAVIRLTAIMKTEEMFFPIHNRSFKQESSSSVLKTIANECELQPEERASTSDVMNWLQINQDNHDMIGHILERSFKENNDAIFACTNREGKFLITSLKTELKNKESLKAIFDPKKTLEDETKPGDENEKKEDEIYYTNYRYSNIAGNINKLIGYGVEYNFYALTGEEKTVNIDGDEHELTDFSFKNKKNSGKIVKHMGGGIKFSADNTHDNYLLALAQNEYIKQTFFASNLLLYINTTDKVKLFSKIQIEMPAMTTVSEEGLDDINEVFSGEYIVGGILHQVSTGGTYKMILSCFRNGMNESTFAEGESSSNKESLAGTPIPKLPTLPTLPF